MVASRTTRRRFVAGSVAASTFIAAPFVRGAHAATFLALVETAGRPHAGLAKKEWLERLEAEHNKHPRRAELVPRA